MKQAKNKETKDIFRYYIEENKEKRAEQREKTTKEIK